MLKLRSHEPRYTHSVDIFSLPEAMQAVVREYTLDHSGEELDYMDGDYYFVLDFTDLCQDLTPETDIKPFEDGDVDESEYPFAGWTEEADDFLEYLLIKRWKEVTQYVRDNIPTELVEANKVAIFCWH